jgi:hypothetical protein
MAQSSLLRAEIPELDKLLSLLSIYSYRLAIGYFGVAKGGRVSSPSFLGGFRGWELVLVVWTPLQEVVLICLEGAIQLCGKIIYLL